MAPLIILFLGVPPGVQVKVVLTMNDPKKMIDYYVTDPAPNPPRSYMIQLDRLGNYNLI